MTTTSSFVGLSSDQRTSSRVLKPPGGGSSIVFSDSESQSTSNGTPKTPQQDSPPSPGTPIIKPPNDTQARLFGDAQLSNSGRKVKDRMKSSIFEDGKKRPVSASPAGSNPTADTPSEDRNSKNDEVSKDSSQENGKISDAAQGTVSTSPKTKETTVDSVDNAKNECKNDHTPQENGISSVSTPSSDSKQEDDGEKSTPSSTEVSVAASPVQVNGSAQPRQRIPPGGFSSKLW